MCPLRTSLPVFFGTLLHGWDLLRPDWETLRHEPEYAARYHETPSLSTYMLVFNCHRGPLADEELRKQFVEMVDVAGLVKRNAGRLAIPAGGLIPPGLLGYEPFRSSRPASASSRWRTGDNIELSCMVHSIFEGPYAPFAQELFGMLRRLRLQPIVVEKKSEYASILQFSTPSTSTSHDGLPIIRMPTRLHTECSIRIRDCTASSAGTPKWID